MCQQPVSEPLLLVISLESQNVVYVEWSVERCLNRSLLYYASTTKNAKASRFLDASRMCACVYHVVLVGISHTRYTLKPPYCISKRFSFFQTQMIQRLVITIWTGLVNLPQQLNE